MQIISIDSFIKKQLPSNDAKRLFHGRGQQFAGWEQINIEIYPPVLWVMVYQAVEEVELIKLLNELIEHRDALGIQYIYIQRRYIRDDPVEVFFGDDSYIDREFVVKEDNAEYLVRLGKNQNTGLFLDMVEGRRYVKSLSEGRKVLNLFSYTCSFGVAAMLGNCRSVLNIDMAKAVVKKGQQNASLNNNAIALQGNNPTASFIAQDVFKVAKKVAKKGLYDLIVIDPPSFQSRAFDVRKDYVKLLGKYKEAMAPGADLLLCLNSPTLDLQFLIDTANAIWPEVTLVGRVKNATVLKDVDESSSLKVMHFTLPA